MFKLIISEMRISQYTKNLLIYAALIFNGSILNPQKFFNASLIFISFCIASSGIYFFNDIFDYDNDKLNPEKFNRPIASGKLNLFTGKIFSGVFIFVGLLISSAVNFKCLLILFSYVILNIFYTIKLKNIVIIDVMIIAYGFVARAIIGAVATEINMTAWFILCIMFLSLFLALSKRRHELTELQELRLKTGREVLKFYTIELIDQMINIVTSCVIISYALFTMDATTKNNNAMALTVPLVLYGIFYYLYIVRVKNSGGSPDKTLYIEKPILLTVSIYLIYVILVRNFIFLF